jgi:hypothetical protein
LGDDLATAVLGAGLGFLAALLERPAPPRKGVAKSRVTDVEAGLRLVFPRAPGRLAAGDMVDLLGCIEGLWLAGMSLASPAQNPEWLPRHTVGPDGTVGRTRVPHGGPEILSTRYGSALDLLIAGGGVGAASTTLLALVVKGDEIATRLFTVPEKIRTRRKQLRAEGLQAERDGAEADKDRARFEQEARRYRGGTLTPAETEAFERLAVDLTAQEVPDARATVMEENFAQEPEPATSSAPFGEPEAAQVLQLRNRMVEIAGPVEAQLELPPSGAV